MDKKAINESRRCFLSTPVKMIPAVALASTGLANVSVHAQEIMPGVPVQPSTAKYLPTFFTNDDDWAFINTIVDHLIPEDEHGPGAVLAGVPEFIDRQMSTPYAYGKLWYMQGPFHPEMMTSNPDMGYQVNLVPRQVYELGIPEFNAWCTKAYGKSFTALEHDVQLQAVKDLSDKKVEFSPDSVSSAVFFAQLLSDTKEGFLSDPMYGGNKGMASWKMIGFPGARADYMDWIDLPNQPYPFGPVSITGEKA